MIDNYKRLPRIRFLLGLIILVTLGALAINKAYQKHFNNIKLSTAEQAELGIDLLEFPRNMQKINALPDQKWASFYIQPNECDTLCVRTLSQLDKIRLDAKSLDDKQTESNSLKIQIISKENKGYSDYWSLVRSEGYTNHFNRILLVNPTGQFAGSIVAPYDLDHWQQINKHLNK